MLALGLNQDMYASGAALAEGGRLLYAANEERFSRRKNAGGFPVRSLEHLLAETGTRPESIDAIHMAGVLTPPLPLRLLGQVQRRFHEAQDSRTDNRLRRFGDFVIHHTPFTAIRAESLIGRAAWRVVPHLVRRALPPALRDKPVHVVEHHHCHAACAHTLSGFGEALAITADGMGDGCAITVNHCRPDGIERLWAAPPAASLGLFFEMLTEAFGMVPSRDEGKLTGLAAGGDAARVTVPPPFTWQGDTLRYNGPRGRQGVIWARTALVNAHRAEDVAAWAQQLLESVLCTLATRWLDRTGLHHLVVAGGTFGNVKLNQRLHELPAVHEFFVAPNMGDGGNGVGALCASGLVRHAGIRDVFLGSGYGADRVARALAAHDGPWRRPDDLYAEVARCLSRGGIVARFTGRAEWGPRALGNRSILADARDPGVSDRLNALLVRSDFMPFAPAVLAEDADELLEGCDGARHAGEFMTLCFRAKAAMRDRFPAAVHVDGTARAQLVRRETNPAFHALLRAWKAASGAPVLLNTSFNIHEEPIVNTPEEALRTFAAARLDALALDDCLVGGVAATDAAEARAPVAAIAGGSPA